ncbi:Histone-Lysine N-Methyltransferase ash1l, partial [Gryganskiella cystojenkinii]
KLAVSSTRNREEEVVMLPEEVEMLAQMQMSRSSKASDSLIAMTQHVLGEIEESARDIKDAPVQEEQQQGYGTTAAIIQTGTRSNRGKQDVNGHDQIVPTEAIGAGSSLSSDPSANGRWLADLTIANMQRQNRAHEEQDMQDRLHANATTTVAGEKTVTERNKRSFGSTIRSGLTRGAPLLDDHREEGDNAGASSSTPRTRPSSGRRQSSRRNGEHREGSLTTSEDLRLRDMPIFKIDSSVATEATTVPGFGVPLSVLAKPRLTQALIADKARTTYAPNPNPAMSSTSSENGAAAPSAAAESTAPVKRRPGRPPGYFLGPTSCAFCRKSHRRCDYNTICRRCAKAKIPCDRTDTVDRPSVIVREARIAVKAEAQKAVAAAVAAGWAIPIDHRATARAGSVTGSAVSESTAMGSKRRRTPSPSDVCRDNIIEQPAKRRAAVTPITKFDPSIYIAPKGNWTQRAANLAAKAATRPGAKGAGRSGSGSGVMSDRDDQSDNERLSIVEEETAEENVAARGSAALKVLRATAVGFSTPNLRQRTIMRPSTPAVASHTKPAFLTPANQVAFLGATSGQTTASGSMLPTAPVKRGPGRPPWKYPPGFIPPPPPPKRSVGRPPNPNKILRGFDANGVKRGPGRPPLNRAAAGAIVSSSSSKVAVTLKAVIPMKRDRDNGLAKLMTTKVGSKTIVSAKQTTPVVKQNAKQVGKHAAKLISESESDDSSEEEEGATPKPKPAVRLVKKTYLKSGLYSSDLKFDTPPQGSNSKTGAKQAFRTASGSAVVVRTTRTGLKAPEHVNTTFPLPINYGASLIEKQRDFVLPFDIMHAWKHGLLRLTKQPEPFTKIRNNIFVERRRRTETSPMVCHCVKPPPGAGRVGCGEDCYNRVMFYECISAHCPCGDQCSNQRFQERHNEDHLRVIYTPERGFGIQTTKPIKRGDLVIEYRGEVISQSLCHERMEGIYKHNKNFYFLEYEKGEVVDACQKGTNARFVNHSCSPNSQIEKWFFNGEMQIGIFAFQDIPAGAEISYDYNFSWFTGAQKQQCRCGAPNCRGYIGERLSAKKTQPQEVSSSGAASSKSGMKKKGEKRKGGNRKVNDTEATSQRLGQMPSVGQIRQRQSDKYKLGKMMAIRYTHLFLFRNVRLVESKYVKYAQTKSRSNQDRVDQSWLSQARQCRKRSLEGVIDDLRAQVLEKERVEQEEQGVPIILELSDDGSVDDESETPTFSETPEDSIVQDGEEEEQEVDELEDDLEEDELEQDEFEMDEPEQDELEDELENDRESNVLLVGQQLYPIAIESDDEEKEEEEEVVASPSIDKLSIQVTATLTGVDMTHSNSVETLIEEVSSSSSSPASTSSSPLSSLLLSPTSRANRRQRMVDSAASSSNNVSTDTLVEETMLLLSKENRSASIPEGGKKRSGPRRLRGRAM